MTEKKDTIPIQIEVPESVFKWMQLIVDMMGNRCSDRIRRHKILCKGAFKRSSRLNTIVTETLTEKAGGNA